MHELRDMGRETAYAIHIYRGFMPAFFLNFFVISAFFCG